MPLPTRCRSSANKRPASPNAPTTSCAIAIGWTPAPGYAWSRIWWCRRRRAGPRLQPEPVGPVGVIPGRPAIVGGDMPSPQRELSRRMLLLGCGGSRVDHPRAGGAGPARGCRFDLHDHREQVSAVGDQHPDGMVAMLGDGVRLEVQRGQRPADRGRVHRRWCRCRPRAWRRCRPRSVRRGVAAAAQPWQSGPGGQTSAVASTWCPHRAVGRPLGAARAAASASSVTRWHRLSLAQVTAIAELTGLGGALTPGPPVTSRP